MSLILVTGVSTAGKSTVANELKKRGHEAYDMEHDGVSAWYDKQTGERAAAFDEMPERTETWLRAHEWRISEQWVKEMAAKAKQAPIFLCGGGANEPAIRVMCDKVIWLKIDEATIRARVNNQRDHDYGTHPHELKKAIEDNERKEVEYKAYGASMIDATRPIDAVVNAVIEAAI